MNIGFTGFGNVDKKLTDLYIKHNIDFKGRQIKKHWKIDQWNLYGFKQHLSKNSY